MSYTLSKDGTIAEVLDSRVTESRVSVAEPRITSARVAARIFAALGPSYEALMVLP